MAKNKEKFYVLLYNNGSYRLVETLDKKGAKRVVDEHTDRSIIIKGKRISVE